MQSYFLRFLETFQHGGYSFIFQGALCAVTRAHPATGGGEARRWSPRVRHVTSGGCDWSSRGPIARFRGGFVPHCSPLRITEPATERILPAARSHVRPRRCTARPAPAPATLPRPRTSRRFRHDIAFCPASRSRSVPGSQQITFHAPLNYPFKKFSI